MSKQSYDIQALYCREMEDLKAVAIPRPNLYKRTVRYDPDDDPAKAAFLAMTPAERAADRAARAALRASDVSLARRYARRMNERMTAALLDAADAAYSLTEGTTRAAFWHAGYSCWRADIRYGGNAKPLLRVYVGTTEAAARPYDGFSKSMFQKKERLRAAKAERLGALLVKLAEARGQGDFAEAA